MTWRTHPMCGLASLRVLEPCVPGSSETYALRIGGAMLGSLRPDLDASESQIRHLSWRRNGIHFEPLQPLASLSHRAFGHRSFLHSLCGLALCGVALVPAGQYLGSEFWGGILLGYASHLGRCPDQERDTVVAMAAFPPRAPRPPPVAPLAHLDRLDSGGGLLRARGPERPRAAAAPPGSAALNARKNGESRFPLWVTAAFPRLPRPGRGRSRRPRPMSFSIQRLSRNPGKAGCLHATGHPISIRNPNP